VPCAAGSTNDSPEPGCRPTQLNGTSTNSRGPVEYKKPPVLPIIIGVIGVQFRPLDALTVNLEVGIRTFPFAGISSSYFF
jgi:hypothetical protein